MRDIQTIFNVVIEAGLYPQQPSKTSHDLMCFALSEAVAPQVISLEEYMFAKGEIEDYLGDSGLLAVALQRDKLPNCIQNRLQIYQDWANKPPLKGSYNVRLHPETCPRY
jgi:hypothetical protein